jgi:tetratricopeptide (TPR) repeat protein
MAARKSLEHAAADGEMRAYWSLGMLAMWTGDEAMRQQAQSAVLAKLPERIPLLGIVAAEDAALAQQAAMLYPDLAEPLSWRALQLEKSDPSRAIELYRQALLIDPLPYEWWLGLGHAYETVGEYQAALLAYEQACLIAVGIIPCHEKRLLLEKMKSP